MDSQPDSRNYYEHDPSQSLQRHYPSPTPSTRTNIPYYDTYSDSAQVDPRYSNHVTTTTYRSQYSPSQSDPSPKEPSEKRIRNTAASARFRAKKKQREVSLERKAAETTAALTKLKERIQELETENRFLKGLIIDKEKVEGMRKELDRLSALKGGLEMDKLDSEKEGGHSTWI